MRKLDGWKELKKGRIYNRVYVGPNAAYAKISGKQTFVVIGTEPALQTQTLFDRFGNPLSDDLHHDNVETIGDPDAVFEEVELYEPADKSEWFVKSARATSLADAIAQGMVPLGDIADRVIRERHFTSHGGANGGSPSVSYAFDVEGKVPAKPLLQRVFVTWTSWSDARKDFASYSTQIE